MVTQVVGRGVVFVGLLIIAASQVSWSQPLRLAFWNITLNGTGTDHVLNLNRTYQALLAGNPDIIACNECNASTIASLASRMTLGTGTTWYYTTAFDVGSRNHSGILSRYPFASSPQLFYYSVPSTLSGGPKTAGKIDVNVNGEIIHVIVTRLDNASGTTRRTQAQELRNWARNLGEPRIILGDFNDWVTSQVTTGMVTEYVDTYREAERRGTAQAYSDNPQGDTLGCNTVDYIYVSQNSGISVTSAQVPDLRTRPLLNPNSAVLERLGCSDDWGVRPSDHNLLRATVNTPAGSGATPPTLSAQPQNRTVTSGQTATFSVTASGTAPLSYQWQSRTTSTGTFANISGATAAAYTTPATTTSYNGRQYRCIVSNSAGSVNSNAATLTVNATAVAPAITVQPQNQSITVGQTATFSVTATGTAPLSYQWEYRTSSTGAWGNVTVAGGTSSTYTTPTRDLTHNGRQYRCRVSNSAGLVYTNIVTLTVTGTSAASVPSITAQPQNQTITEGQTATFSVTATGTGPLSYRWQYQTSSTSTWANVTVTGGTSATYTTPTRDLSHNGRGYRCVVSNAAGSVTSNAVVLTVQPQSSSLSASEAASESTLVPSALSGVRVYPNPWRSDRHAGHTITFDTLGMGSTVKIFTISGYLVRTLIPVTDTVTWDLKNDRGDQVASGLYIYLITNQGAKRTGQISIIR